MNPYSGSKREKKYWYHLACLLSLFDTVQNASVRDGTGQHTGAFHPLLNLCGNTIVDRSKVMLRMKMCHHTSQ